MNGIAKLEAIEDLKRLKARYFYHLDRKDWKAWGDVFAEDAAMDVSSQFPDAPDPSIYVMRGRSMIVESVSASLGETVTAHHGHTPIIDVQSETDATGIWAMEDNLFMPDGSRMSGYGYYEESYRRTDDAWRIALTKLVRIKVIVSGPPAV